jgi:hypothetical protein
VFLESPLHELIREAYAGDGDLRDQVDVLRTNSDSSSLSARQRAQLHRYSLIDSLLYYQVSPGDDPRMVVPNDEDLRHRILFEAHDTALSGHLGREKTYTSVARDFWWPHMYKWVRSYVKTCETCQRVKPSPAAATPLMSLPVPADCWRLVSMDFIFELPSDGQGHTGILVFVCRLSKMVRLIAMKKSVIAPQAAQLCVDHVFRLHGLPEAFVSDRDPRFVSHFWQHLFRLLGTKIDMSTADHPQTEGQTERVNRVLEDVLRSVCVAEPTKWSTQLAQVEFALNNGGHASTGFTSFYVNGLRHPRTPLSLPPASELGEERVVENDSRGLTGVRPSVKRNLLSFIETGEAIRTRVRDAMAAAQDRQKENSDRHGRANTNVFEIGDLVLLNARNLPTQAVSAVGSTKLRPRFVGPFSVIGVHGNAYTLDLPSAMATHPTFYVGMLKPYHPAEVNDSASPTSSRSDEGLGPSLAPSRPESGLGQPEQPAQPRHSEEPESPRWLGAHRRGGTTQDAHAERDDPSPEHPQDPRSGRGGDASHDLDKRTHPANTAPGASGSLHLAGYGVQQPPPL